MFRASLTLACFFAMVPAACRDRSETTGQSSWAVPNGRPTQKLPEIDPPNVIVPTDHSAKTFTCLESGKITLPDGVTEDDIKTWVKDHAHLVHDQEEFDALCARLRAGLDEIIKHSLHGTTHLSDPTLAWLLTKARAAAIVTIAEPPATGGDSGAPAIIGTTTDTVAAEFACGKQGSRNVLCASSAPPPAGNWVVVSTILSGPALLNDASLSHQYAFVFDEDGEPLNNYAAPAQYPYDFFDGTDRWYQVGITSGSDPILQVQDAKNGNVQPYASQARVVLEDNLVMALIPLSEFTNPCPGYRATTFAHNGDYGINPPYFWGGDTEPVVDTGLYNVCDP